MKLRTSYFSLASSLALALACGSSEPEPEAEPQTSATTGAEMAKPPAMQVEGLMGTIPERKIRATLEPKLPSFARCFARGAADVEPIAGRMELYFRVALDGSVEWVYPRASSVGHRGTEQCVLEIARAVRFPGPKGGGAAELAWSFELEGGDVRAPVEWEASNVEPVVEANRDALAACGLAGGGTVLTLYVAPGGAVIAAGGAARTREAAEQLDCALSAVASWQLPDPGSYMAKVSIELP